MCYGEVHGDNAADLDVATVSAEHGVQFALKVHVALPAAAHICLAHATISVRPSRYCHLCAPMACLPSPQQLTRHVRVVLPICQSCRTHSGLHGIPEAGCVVTLFATPPASEELHHVRRTGHKHQERAY
eukprot:jgi/Ulvmu1/7932/UM004_0165.1